MLNNISIGSYYPKKSFVHEINCVVKILSTLLFVVGVFWCYNLTMLLILLLASILFTVSTSLPKKILLSNFLAFKYLFIFLIVVYAFVERDLILAFNICIKVYTIMIYTTIFTMTTKTNEITYSLKVIMSPLKIIKIPINKIAFSISTSLRFIPTIINQANKIVKSQRSRGVDYYSKSIKKKLLSIRSLIVPLFIITMKNSDTLAETLYLRLYDINSNYDNYIKKRVSVSDIIYLTIHIIVFLIIIGM